MCSRLLTRLDEKEIENEYAFKYLWSKFWVTTDKSLAMNAKCKRMVGRDTSGAAKALDAASMNGKLENTGRTAFGSL